MSRAKEILKKIYELWDDDTSIIPIKPNNVKKAFQERLAYFEMDGVSVDDVDIDLEGNIRVTFSDYEDDIMEVLFGYDEDNDEGAYAMILGEDDDEEYFIMDLDPMNPVILQTEQFGKYVNLTDLSWVNKSMFASMFSIGEIDFFSESQVREGYEGNLSKDFEGYEKGNTSKDEVFKTVVRGGKKIRLPVVRKKRKKALSAKQRAGIVRAKRKRKMTMKTSASKMKRKKSLKIRKKLGIKKTKLPKGYKVRR